MPLFFVPGVPEDEQEAEYQRLAGAVHGVPGAPDRRIYSLTWRHTDDVWTATVGETLRGTRTIIKGRGRNQTSREVPVHNESTVLAIFDGGPTPQIVHDNKSRYWNNPIMTGKPLGVIYFDA